MSDEQHEGEPSPRIDDACDSLAMRLDDTKQVIVTLRATMEQMRRERDEARAKLARIRSECHGVRENDFVRMENVLRIIDEKEGGQ